jgi:hypothetical protein
LHSNRKNSHNKTLQAAYYAYSIIFDKVGIYR